jgi:hypothetical protein
MVNDFYPSIEFENYEFYYNLNGHKSACITMDVDWAPDDILKSVFDWFIDNKIKITAFITHESIVAKEYSSSEFIEIALHPNFSKALDPNEKVSQLLKEYPNSVGSRSHRNIIGRDFTDALFDHMIKYDSSKLIWRAKNVEIHPIYNKMVEAPYIWEDGVHLELDETTDPSKMNFNHAGLKILNIHPVLFYLNFVGFKQLKKFTSQFTDLTSVSKEKFDTVRQTTFGIGDFSKQMFLNLQSDGYDFFLLKQPCLLAHETYQKQNPALLLNKWLKYENKI